MSIVEKQFPRLWNITDGRWMVVTDLHGNGRLYEQYRSRFLELYEAEEVQGLIIMGDLIHSSPRSSRRDDSLDMVLDMMGLQQQFGDRVIYLCGNHELPHIYSFPLSKGNVEFTPPFEKMLTESERREEIISFFEQLPFYLRTPAGVSLTHAGAFEGVSSTAAMQQLFNWDHQAVLHHACEVMSRYDREALRHAYAQSMRRDSYADLAAHYLGLSDPSDPHYDDLILGNIAMRGFSFELSYFLGSYTKKEVAYDRDETLGMAQRFQTLWDALFTKCEHMYPDYKRYLDALLSQLSQDYMAQKWVISGHIDINSDYKQLYNKQFRIASGKHARPISNARYLIFDAAVPPTSNDLRAGLGKIDLSDI